MPLPRARIQRGKKFILDIHAGPGQGVHQGAFAGVGVADQGNRVFLAAAAYLTFFAGLNFNEAGAQIADPLGHQAAVFLQLRFARAA